METIGVPDQFIFRVPQSGGQVYFAERVGSTGTYDITWEAGGKRSNTTYQKKHVKEHLTTGVWKMGTIPKLPFKVITEDGTNWEVTQGEVEGEAKKLTKVGSSLFMFYSDSEIIYRLEKETWKVKEERKVMEPLEQLGEAIAIATDQHRGQTTRDGKPYILHPLHLMQGLMYDPVLAAIAVCHDVIEDCFDNPKEGLDYFKEKGFCDRFLNALDRLTHRKEVHYSTYIDCIAGSLDAIKVKRKDLEHNMQASRLSKVLTEKDHTRMVKYSTAFIDLGKARDKYHAKS